MRLAALVAILAWAVAASAQPPPPAKPPQTRAECLDVDTVPGNPLQPQPPPEVVVTPMPWSDFVVIGPHLQDPPATIHALLEPTLSELHTTLTVRRIPDLAKVTTKLGYQLVSLTTRAGASGQTLVITLEPLPIVRKVEVKTRQGLFERPLDEEVKRRMLIRVGAPLPGDPLRRRCAIREEEGRIDDYLHDEGYSDAKATIADDGAPTAVHVTVNVALGDEYRLDSGQPKVVLPAGFTAVTPAEIRKQFEHSCVSVALLGLEFGGGCRFTRAQFVEDLQKVRELFHRREFPAARVLSNFDAKASFDRASETVRITVTVDPRRRLHLEFEGVDPDAISRDDLRKHVTFDESGSTDDIEAQTSAHALETYLQTRGYFDVRVTIGPREHLPEYDQVTFHIALGRTRQVETVAFTCNGAPCGKNHKPFDDAALRRIVATKTIDVIGDFLGTTVSPTSELLADDEARLREAYRRTGYREAQVSVSASPTQAALGNAAVTAALVEGDIGEGLAVGFTIDEGQPTRLARVEIVPDDPADAPQLSSVCDALLHELANELASDVQPDPAAALARRTSHTACTASSPALLFREDDVAATRDRLRDFLFKQGRPRAEIDYEAHEIAPHVVEARYVIHHVRSRTLGKLVVRGNFKTHTKVIREVLDLHEGQLLTSDVLADGARRLRQTGLFSAVNIDLLDLQSPAEQVDAVVNIEERYDVHAQVDVEFGYSSYNGLFGTLAPLFANPLGNGISLKGTVTYGENIHDYEGTLRIPKWLLPLGGAQVDLTYGNLFQNTPAFGPLTTESATVAVTKINVHQGTGPENPASTLSYGLHYDYRLRTRNLDALRPIGTDLDESQVAVQTQTGSIGATIDVDHRIDRNGHLSPLAAENGYHLFANLAYAMPAEVPLIGGQDTFIKLSTSASYFRLLGGKTGNLVVRADFHYDEGFPLGGAALLPDVERFFAGGDNTVRGYEDDRLATEVVRVPVPPIGGSLTQIRVIPAGGNIRVMSSLDAQYRIIWIFAAAAFVDAGMIANDWRLVTADDIRPSVGMGARALTPFGIVALEYAVPINPHLGDDPRGRYHFYFAARATF